MTVKQAAKVLSERMQHRIGPGCVMDLILAGQLGFKDMTRPGAKRRRLVIQLDHIDTYVGSQGVITEQKPAKKAKRPALDPRVRC